MNESPKRATGGQPGNVNGAKSGVYALMKLRKMGKPDGRTAFGRMFRQREAEYTHALGGDLAPMMATLVNDVTWLDFYVGTIDGYLSGLRSLARKNKPHPLVDVRVKLANSRRENLKLIGLKRVTKPLTLDDLLAEDDEPDDETSQDEVGATNGGGESEGAA